MPGSRHGVEAGQVTPYRVVAVGDRAQCVVREDPEVFRPGALAPPPGQIRPRLVEAHQVAAGVHAQQRIAARVLLTAATSRNSVPPRPAAVVTLFRRVWPAWCRKTPGA